MAVTASKDQESGVKEQQEILNPSRAWFWSPDPKRKIFNSRLSSETFKLFRILKPEQKLNLHFVNKKTLVKTDVEPHCVAFLVFVFRHFCLTIYSAIFVAQYKNTSRLGMTLVDIWCENTVQYVASYTGKNPKI